MNEFMSNPEYSTSTSPMGFPKVETAPQRKRATRKSNEKTEMVNLQEAYGLSIKECSHIFNVSKSEIKKWNANNPKHETVLQIRSLEKILSLAKKKKPHFHTWLITENSSGASPIVLLQQNKTNIFLSEAYSDSSAINSITPEKTRSLRKAESSWLLVEK